MIPKCGELRVWHWAHQGTLACDPWREPETPWHRHWKSHFPEHWQEIFHSAENGERHIADVKTESGIAIEFQHSPLRRDERESRENFYPKMVWVVNGRRRERDSSQLFASLDATIVINREPLIVSVPNEGALLRYWGGSRVPVYFDFGDSEPGNRLRFDAPILWRLDPRSPNGRAYLSPVSKTLFLHFLLKGVPFDEMYTEAVERVAAGVKQQDLRRSRPLIGFERYMARRQRARPHF
jgi:hypothetical protein